MQNPNLFVIPIESQKINELELYQNDIISAFFRYGCATTAFVHAALPHEKTSLQLCCKTKTEKRCILIQLHKINVQNYLELRGDKEIEPKGDRFLGCDCVCCFSLSSSTLNFSYDVCTNVRFFIEISMKKSFPQKMSKSFASQTQEISRKILDKRIPGWLRQK